MSGGVTDAEVLPCSGCGYDLRTVPLGDRCPECGVAVAAEAARLRPLTQRGAVVAGLRLLSLFLGLQALTLIEVVVVLFASSVPGGLQPLGADLGALAGQAVLVGLRLGLAAGLWWAAPRLAALALRRDAAVFAGDGPAAGAVLRVGLVLLGAWLFATGAAAAAAIVTQTPAFFGEQPDFVRLSLTQQAVGGTIRAVLGLFLLFHRPLHRLLVRGLGD